jgi:hypothetical protein
VKGRSSVALVCSLTIAIWAPPARASSLSAVLEQGPFAELRLAPLGPALANTVALTYPVASASSSVTYVYNPALDVLERRSGVGGPIIGERAETIGRGVLDVALSYSYVRLTSVDGEDLDRLVNRPVVNGRMVSFPVEDGTILKNGRFTNFLPVRVVADFGIDAHIVTPSFTYGVTPDLDLNLTLPILRTALDVETRSQVPDPRLPSFALPAGSPLAGMERAAASASAAGIGDLLLRAKYLLLREHPVDVAALLGLSLPTGDADDFQGTGTTRVQPALVVSRVFGAHFEPLLNLGVDLNADDVGRSIVRWAVGTTAQVGPLTGALVFLGRHELGRQSDRIQPAFFLPDRAQRPVRRVDGAPMAVRGQRLRVGQRAGAAQPAGAACGRDPDDRGGVRVLRAVVGVAAWVETRAQRSAWRAFCRLYVPPAACEIARQGAVVDRGYEPPAAANRETWCLLADPPPRGSAGLRRTPVRHPVQGRDGALPADPLRGARRRGAAGLRRDLQGHRRVRADPDARVRGERVPHGQPGRAPVAAHPSRQLRSGDRDGVRGLRAARTGCGPRLGLPGLHRPALGTRLDAERLFPAALGDAGRIGRGVVSCSPVDTFGAHLRQVTRFREGEHSANGCGLGPPPGCTIRDAAQDPVTRSVVFYSICDPFGTNPYGAQVFAMRPDGTRLRQLTATRGRVEEAGAVSVELPGPIAYSGNSD